MTNITKTRIFLSLLLLAGSIFLAIFTSRPLRDGGGQETWLNFDGSYVNLRRDIHGLLHIYADSFLGFNRGLGYAHAYDRLMQMYVQKYLGEGRMSEMLMCSDVTVGIDSYVRELDLLGMAKRLEKKLTSQQIQRLAAYSEGVNRYLEEYQFVPSMDSLIVQMKLEKWTVLDTILTAHVIGYLGLAEGQLEIEKFMVHIVRLSNENNAQSLKVLKKLFSTENFHGFDDELIEKLRKTTFEKSLVGDDLLDVLKQYYSTAPIVSASNNWVIASNFSEYGFPLFAADPHLQINRLPTVFYETAMESNDGQYLLGISMPGIPGIIMGKSKYVAWSLTYGMADQVDLTVEEVKDLKVKRPNNQWIPLKIREESLHLKNGSIVRLKYYYTEDHGTLELKNSGIDRTLSDGFYFARRWGWSLSEWENFEFTSLEENFKWRKASDLFSVLGRTPMPANWLIADIHHNIAYQQGGLFPDRGNFSGLIPILGSRDPAWSKAKDLSTQHRIVNPEKGYIVTANGKFPGITVHNGHYRTDRGIQLLESKIKQKKKLNLADMISMQTDAYSLQAERFLKIFKTLLPDSENGRELSKWDGRFPVNSRAGVLYQALYDELIAESIGRALCGSIGVYRLFKKQSSNVIDLIAHAYDDLFFEAGEDAEYSKILFGNLTRDQFIQKVASVILSDNSGHAFVQNKNLTFSDAHPLTLNNILYQGSLPKWTGYDVGPLHLPGHKTTLLAFNVRERNGQTISIGATWRFVSSLAHDSILTTSPGGTSGRVWSIFYTNDLENYVHGKYKNISLIPKKVYG